MSFNVVIDSENAYATTSIYDKDYAFDWSVFERNCKYEMTYSFKSSPIADVDSDVECIALVGLGTQQRTFTAGNKTTTQTNNIIGLLNRQTIREADAGHEKQYYTQPSVKPNIYLTNTPANNIFKVRIHSGNGDVATAGLTGSNYILILHFNKVEDGNKTY